MNAAAWKQRRGLSELLEAVHLTESDFSELLDELVHHPCHRLLVFTADVTPAIATRLLDNMAPNRRENKRNTLNLSRDMASGAFPLNGEPAILSPWGRMLDARHRCEAIKASGKTIRMVVVAGVEDGLFKTIDIGKKRSRADALGAAGVPHAATVAAAVVWQWRLETDQMDTSASNPSAGEHERVLQQHPGLVEAAEYVKSSPLKSIAMPGVLAFLRYQTKMRNAAKSDWFFDKLELGEGLRSDWPVYLLRERLRENNASRAKLPPANVMALCIKAWNATVDGRDLRHLSFRSKGDKKEEFPTFREPLEGDDE